MRVACQVGKDVAGCRERTKGVHMPALTYYLLLAALLVLALLVANAIFYRHRFGTFLRPEKRPDQRQPLPRAELWLSSLMVLGFLAGFASPVLAPASSFAQWLSQPYSQLAYYAWCFLAPILASVAISARALLQKHRRPIQ
jgi:hypothetical protein